MKEIVHIDSVGKGERGITKRAYRRYMRKVKIKKRMREQIALDKLISCSVPITAHTGFLADTPKRCSSSDCCGNRRVEDGPTIQEKRHVSNLG